MTAPQVPEGPSGHSRQGGAGAQARVCRGRGGGRPRPAVCSHARLRLHELGVRKAWRGGWRDTEPNAPPSGAAAILGPKLQGEQASPEPGGEGASWEGAEGAPCGLPGLGGSGLGEAPAPPAKPPGAQRPLTEAMPASLPPGKRRQAREETGSVQGRTLGVLAQEGGAQLRVPWPRPDAGGVRCRAAPALGRQSLSGWVSGS